MKKYALGFIVGMLVMGGAAYAAELLVDAKSISYSSEYTTSNNVADAIDEILSSGIGCPDGYACNNLKSLYDLTKMKSQGKLAYDSSSNPFSNMEDGRKATNGVWEYDEDTMDANSDGGTEKIYYYRGAVSDNNVYFSGKCWKIIRTTSTGGVKLFYNGTNSGTEDNPVCNGDDSVFNYENQKFNASYGKYYYSFYTYDENDFLGTGTDSLIKTYVEGTVYNTIGLGNTISGTDKKWEDLLEDHPYCMDRRYNTSSSGTTYTQYESNSGKMYYGGYIRAKNTKKPTLDCESEDQLTVANKRLSKKIGLITVDEIMLAGGTLGDYNNYYYMYYSSWWTITPSNWSGTPAKSIVEYKGNIGIGGEVSYSYSARPVVSLASTTVVNKGNGTSDSPYVIGVA